MMRMSTNLAFGALIALFFVFSSTVIASESNPEAALNNKNKAEIARNGHIEEKYKEIMQEATAAVRETKNALKSLNEKKVKEALVSLERATGKLEIILAREPDLALAPADVDVVTFDLLADIEAVNKLREEIKKAFDNGRIQEARRLIRGLASETVITVKSIPLASYPDAIKESVKLIDEDKPEEAIKVLQTALTTQITTDTIIPLPIATARSYLMTAEILAKDKDRNREEEEKLAKILKDVREELEFAQALGYGSKKDFNNLYVQLARIEAETESGKPGSSFFEKILKSIKTLMPNSINNEQ